MARVSVATDDFASSISASWTQGEGDTDTFTWVTGGHIQPTAAGAAQNRIRRNTGTYGNDQYSQVTVQTLSSADGGGIGAYTRCQASSTDETSYFGGCGSNAGYFRYAIVEMDSSFGITVLTQTGTGTSKATGDTITLENEGTALRLYTNESGGGDTLRLSTTDATITSGWPGICAWSDVDNTHERITAWDGGNVTAAGAITGSIALALTPTGALTGTGALAGTVALTLTPSGLLRGTGALAGSIGLALTPSGALTGTGALAGAIALSLTPTGTLTGAGALAGSIPMTFAPTGTLIGTGALAGSISLAFGLSGTFEVGAMLGDVPLVLTASGALTGSGALASSIPLTISPTGALTGTGALAGTVPLAFDLSGALTGTAAGALTGGIALTVNVTGAMTGTGALTGSVALSIGVAGALTRFGADDDDGFAEEWARANQKRQKRRELDEQRQRELLQQQQRDAEMAVILMMLVA